MASLKQLLVETVGRIVFKELTVEAVDEVAPAFFVLRLAGLAGASSPGDKLQLLFDEGPRTYSPFSQDGSRVTLLAYEHDEGSASRFLRGAKPGDRVRGFGPRGSLALPPSEKLVLFGDETSLGVACAAQHARCVLEVRSVADAEAALRSVGRNDCRLVEKREGDAHMVEVMEHVRSLASPLATLALTGKAQSIQAVRASLKAQPAAFASQKNKAYWAPGKKGLD